MAKTSSNKDSYADKVIKDIERTKEFRRIQREAVRIKYQLTKKK